MDLNSFKIRSYDVLKNNGESIERWMWSAYQFLSYKELCEMQSCLIFINFSPSPSTPNFSDDMKTLSISAYIYFLLSLEQYFNLI